MKKDVLQEYISLQSALHREREELVGRLRQIDDVLGQPSPFGASAPRVGRKGRGVNNMSLKDAVLRVTATRAMTKQEVYDAVQKLGYKFGGKDPLNSLGVVLYGKNPRFRNDGGRFSPTSLPVNGLTGHAGGRRGMSAAARERIAAAQRARWARQKGGGSASTKPKRKMSAAGRARIAAAARARWAKFRAAK